MQRTIITNLLNWKESPERKVLLLRGARQVGKTFIVRELGKTFPNFIEVNLEKDAAVAGFFEKDFNPGRICMGNYQLFTASQFTKVKPCCFSTKFRPAQRLFRHCAFFTKICPDCMSLLPVRCSNLPWPSCRLLASAASGRCLCTPCRFRNS